MAFHQRKHGIGTFRTVIDIDPTGCRYAREQAGAMAIEYPQVE